MYLPTLLIANFCVGCENARTMLRSAKIAEDRRCDDARPTWPADDHDRTREVDATPTSFQIKRVIMADQVEKICPFCQGIYLGSEIKRHISVEHLGIPKALQSKQQNNAEIQEEKKDLKKTEHSKQSKKISSIFSMVFFCK